MKSCAIRHNFKFLFTLPKYIFPFPTLSALCKNSTHILHEHLNILVFLRKILILNLLHWIWSICDLTKHLFSHHEKMEDLFETLSSSIGLDTSLGDTKQIYILCLKDIIHCMCHLVTKRMQHMAYLVSKMADWHCGKRGPESNSLFVKICKDL